MAIEIENNKVKVSFMLGIKELIDSPTLHTRLENDFRIEFRNRFTRDIYEKINSKMQDIINESIEEVKNGG